MARRRTSPVVQHEIAATSFSFFTAEETLALSVKHITASVSYDEFGHPIPG
jgi:hypothetical protein